MPVASLAEDQILRISQLFKQMKFPSPDGKVCLVLSCVLTFIHRGFLVSEPCGRVQSSSRYHQGTASGHDRYVSRKVFLVTFDATESCLTVTLRRTRVFEGHPFIVEAAVSLGGKTVNPGLNVYRFANRIPLLFEAGADVVTRTAARKINWALYKIKQNVDKIGVFVSIVSTKIPFKGTGKEYIGDDIEEMAAAVKVSSYLAASFVAELTCAFISMLSSSAVCN